LARLGSQIAQSLDFASIEFPNGPVQPGQRWRAERRLSIPSLDEEISALAQVVYTFQGMRTISDRDMAVVKLSGRIYGPRNQALGLTGAVTGSALVDVELGRVARLNAVVDTTLNVSIEGEKVHARSRVDLRLSRN